MAPANRAAFSPNDAGNCEKVVPCALHLRLLFSGHVFYSSISRDACTQLFKVNSDPSQGLLGFGIRRRLMDGFWVLSLHIVSYHSVTYLHVDFPRKLMLRLGAQFLVRVPNRITSRVRIFLWLRLHSEGFLSNFELFFCGNVVFLQTPVHIHEAFGDPQGEVCG